jgi:hypothetical protein
LSICRWADAIVGFAIRKKPDQQHEIDDAWRRVMT